MSKSSGSHLTVKRDFLLVVCGVDISMKKSCDFLFFVLVFVVDMVKKTDSHLTVKRDFFIVDR